MRRSVKILLAVGVPLAAFLIYYQFRFQHFSVSTAAMSPALNKGAIILVDKSREGVKRNDVLVFHQSDGPYVFRAVGMPGETIEIKDGKLFVNSKEEIAAGYKYECKVSTEGSELNHKGLLKKKIISEPMVYHGYGDYTAYLTHEEQLALNKISAVTQIQLRIHPTHYYGNDTINWIFPNTSDNSWSRDNFGPIKVPKKGIRIKLNSKNTSLYKKSIQKEGHTIAKKGDSFFIDTIQAIDYTFEQNHYWVMGDNRHNALDSRYWGFVSDTDIIGIYIKTLVE